MGIEPTLSAWKAEVLPLNYTRMVEGAGFEPAKAEPSDLQSDPFGRSGIPPLKLATHYKACFFQNQALFCVCVKCSCETFLRDSIEIKLCLYYEIYKHL